MAQHESVLEPRPDNGLFCPLPKFIFPLPLGHNVVLLEKALERGPGEGSWPEPSAVGVTFLV